MAAKQDSLDPQTRDLVRFAAAIAQGYEPELRERVGPLRSSQVPVQWVEELLLQSVLMTGYPRALVAFNIWRKFSGVPAPAGDEGVDYALVGEWTRRGEEVCGTVYGENYRKLRDSVRTLHPAVDSWMITEGYGRTLGRSGLDLLRRELCIVAQTAVLETPRQLHSHLRGRAQRRSVVRADRGRPLDREPAAVVRPVEEGEGSLAHRARRVVAGELMFIDRAVVRVTAGTGGSGASSFARFKYKPKGGPDGGDGGHGGHVFVRGDANLTTLLDYRYRTAWKADRGEHGKGKTQTGASAEDIYLPVPPGTIIRDADSGEPAG